MRPGKLAWKQLNKSRWAVKSLPHNRIFFRYVTVDFIKFADPSAGRPRGPKNQGRSVSGGVELQRSSPTKSSAPGLEMVGIGVLCFETIVYSHLCDRPDGHFGINRGIDPRFVSPPTFSTCNLSRPTEDLGFGRARRCFSAVCYG